MNVELKPCPFCGGDPDLEVVTQGYTNTAYTIGAELRCKACAFHMRADSVFEVDAFMNVNICSNGIGHMIENWNRRASDGKTD